MLKKTNNPDNQVPPSRDSILDSSQTQGQDLPVDSKDTSYIIIDKQTMTLQLIVNGKIVMQENIACGRNYGNKQRPGDLRTPEGVFHIESIQDASGWSHDFKDGKGAIEGAYGPWFIRLNCPGHSGIGIHGTHDPNSIGKRCTEGCIRMLNEKLEELKMKVHPGMVVIIRPSNRDIATNDSLQKVAK